MIINEIQNVIKTAINDYKNYNEKSNEINNIGYIFKDTKKSLIILELPFKYTFEKIYNLNDYINLCVNEKNYRTFVDTYSIFRNISDEENMLCAFDNIYKINKEKLKNIIQILFDDNSLNLNKFNKFINDNDNIILSKKKSYNITLTDYIKRDFSFIINKKCDEIYKLDNKIISLPFISRSKLKYKRYLELCNKEKCLSSMFAGMKIILFDFNSKKVYSEITGINILEIDYILSMTNDVNISMKHEKLETYAKQKFKAFLRDCSYQISYNPVTLFLTIFSAIFAITGLIQILQQANIIKEYE